MFLLAGAPAAALANDSVKTLVIDDGSAGKAMLERFDYIGHWQHVHDKYDGRSAGTSTRSTHMGDVAIVRFEGTRIRLYGVRGPSGGRAGIALDGASTGGPVDFYAPNIQPHSLIYQSAVLLPGVHTLSIIVWGLRDERARYYYVNLDDAEIETQAMTAGEPVDTPARTAGFGF